MSKNHIHLLEFSGGVHYLSRLSVYLTYAAATKKCSRDWMWWSTPVTSATLEAEEGELQSEANPGKSIMSYLKSKLNLRRLEYGNSYNYNKLTHS
jgi:hypothetical protein